MVDEAVTGQPPPDGPDDSADTQMFRKFVEREDEPVTRSAVGAPFRIVTLLIGLAVFAVLIWLLFKL